MSKSKFLTPLLWVSFFACWASHVFAAPQWFAEPYDRLPWSFETSGNVIAVGDVHGDLSALAAILSARGLVDAKGRWIGGSNHLVLMGDYADRGDYSREILDWIQWLEPQAQAAGGRIHGLAGNHELMILSGDVRYTTRAEAQGFAEFRRLKSTGVLAEQLQVSQSKAAVVQAFRYENPYADWLGKRNTVVRINRTLFVHGGLEDWSLEVVPGRVNATVRAWIQFYQGKRSKPPQSTAWAVDEGGPLWSRALAENRLAPETLAAILKKLDVDRIVIGHTPTGSGLIERRYNGRVIMVDSGISAAYEGGLTSLLITNNSVRAQPEVPRPRQNNQRLKSIVDAMVSCRLLQRSYAD